MRILFEFSLKPLTVVGVLFFSLSFTVPVNVLYLTLDKTKSCVCVCVPELNWQCSDSIFHEKLKETHKTAVRELTADTECIFVCVCERARVYVSYKM